MKAVIQRVGEARVVVEGEVTGEIGRGLLVLLGVARGDAQADADYLAAKIASLRIFPDEHGKMNLDVKEIGGSILVVSQFTLYGDTRKGRRPSYDRAADPNTAKQLYEYFVESMRRYELPVHTGIFQANMQVSLQNEGPVTLICDSVNNRI